MKKVIDFLSELDRNNNREWFEANRHTYLEAKEEFERFASELIIEMGKRDESVAGLTLKDCTYRIYRDTRFSKDKTPYKNHMGVYMAPGGKKSGYAGYYFHVGQDYGEGSFMSAGAYCVEGKVIKSIREEIFDNYDGICASIDRAKGFKLNTENKLVRLPAGYTPGNPCDEMLKLKDFYLEKPLDVKWLNQKALAKAAAKEFAKASEFIALLNRAIRYAYEEME